MDTYPCFLFKDDLEFVDICSLRYRILWWKGLPIATEQPQHTHKLRHQHSVFQSLSANPKPRPKTNALVSYSGSNSNN